MLKPETARTILNLIINLVLLAAGLTVAGLIWSMVTGGLQRSTLSTGVPVSVSVSTSDQSFQISRVNFVRFQPETWMWVLWLAYIGLLLALVVLGYGRMKRFVNRLLDNPFAPENAADLRLASRLALISQGFSLVVTFSGWWTVQQTQPVTALQTALKGSPNIQVVQQVANYTVGGLSFFGINLTPLLVAALLAVLATVFQRAHDLREAERLLRTEQELTV